jgi:hypothetical protein
MIEGAPGVEIAKYSDAEDAKKRIDEFFAKIGK